MKFEHNGTSGVVRASVGHDAIDAPMLYNLVVRAMCDIEKRDRDSLSDLEWGRIAMFVKLISRTVEVNSKEGIHTGDLSRMSHQEIYDLYFNVMTCPLALMQAWVAALDEADKVTPDPE